MFIGTWQAQTSIFNSYAFTPGSNTASASVSLMAFADARTNPGCVEGTHCGHVNADISAEYDISLLSTGPARSGVLVLNYNQNYQFSFTPAGATFNINGTFVPCLGFTCNVINRAIPIPLGQGLSFSLFAHSSSSATVDAGTSGPSFAANSFTASVFEADGVTPVALLDPAAFPSHRPWRCADCRWYSFCSADLEIAPPHAQRSKDYAGDPNDTEQQGACHRCSLRDL